MQTQRARHTLPHAAACAFVALAGASNAALAAEDCTVSEVLPVALTTPGPHGAIDLVGGVVALNRAHSATHNQILVGPADADTFYLYHLPLFQNAQGSHPHNFQVVAEARLADAEDMAALQADRAASSEEIYTVNPDPFDQTLLGLSYPGSPPLPPIGAVIFSGHLERGGSPVLDGRRVPLVVERVIHFRELAPNEGKTPAPHYVIFGDRDGAREAYLAHALTAPPDFDQLLRVRIEADRPLDGHTVTLNGRSNEATARLAVGDVLRCALEGAPDAGEVAITVEAEPYCEVGEVGQIDFRPSRDCPDVGG